MDRICRKSYSPFSPIVLHTRNTYISGNINGSVMNTDHFLLYRNGWQEIKHTFCANVLRVRIQGYFANQIRIQGKTNLWFSGGAPAKICLCYFEGCTSRRKKASKRWCLKIKDIKHTKVLQLGTE